MIDTNVSCVVPAGTIRIRTSWRMERLCHSQYSPGVTRRRCAGARSNQVLIDVAHPCMLPAGNAFELSNSTYLQEQHGGTLIPSSPERYATSASIGDKRDRAIDAHTPRCATCLRPMPS